MANETVFHPYKIISQSTSSLQLEAGISPKTIRIVFLLAPIFLIIAGIVLYITQKEIYFLFIFCGIAVLEYFIFSFIKVPGHVQMDTVGFTLDQASIKGVQQLYYTWSDVDYIRFSTLQVKGSQTLAYDVILNNGKKLKFLAFPHYIPARVSVENINATLHAISKKDIRRKA